MGRTDASDSAAMAVRQLEWLRRLVEAVSPRLAAGEIVRLAGEDRAWLSASVAWGFDAAGEPECVPADGLAGSDIAWVRAAAAKAGPVYRVDGSRIAFRLADAQPAVLLVEIEDPDERHRFIDENASWLEIAGRHLARALETAELRGSLKRMGRSERLQHALFAISDLAGSDRDMPDMLRGIQAIVGTLMYAENFFIVSYNAERDTLRFLYFVDVEDRRPRDPHLEIAMASRERSLTWYVIRDGKPLMGTTEQLLAQISGPLVIIGPDSYDWLGVPMLRDGRVQGAIVVQSYREGTGFSADDRTLLEFVANHILIALERKQGKADLEQRVRLRTIELAEANKVLQLEIIERQRAERLQKALFQIAQLATADISQDEFYHRVHAVVGALLNANNFFIGLLSEDGRMLDFPYYLDGGVDALASRPLGRGLSEYVLRNGTPLRAMTAAIVDLAHQGEVDPLMAGTKVVCWLGVPLFVDVRAIGLIVVQSYDAGVVYDQADQDLLSFVATQVANSLHRRRAAESLRLANAQLEQRVAERTRDLTATLNQLRDTQGELVRQEKLASLGALVAGIAHEINTPLGICVTATSHVRSEIRHWRQENEAGQFDAQRVEGMLDELDVTVRVLESNIRRGAELVRSFKQIAVDQSSGKRRNFDLAEYLDEIVLSLKPKLKLSPCTVSVECPQGIEMNSFPGALSQVVTNLVMNALLHAFEGRDKGMIRVQGSLDDDEVVLAVSDDGIGMNEADLKRFFDPFFTTKRGSGGTGLGANIVFNQVTNVLGGSIRATSRPGAGTQVLMRLPRELERTCEPAIRRNLRVHSQHRGQHLRERLRPRQQEALHFVAAALAQPVELLGSFHALGDRAQAEAVREADDRGADRRVVVVPAEVAHEAAVDLEPVDRQALEVGQARIAGAEIVHRDRHADPVEPAHHVDRRLRVGHDHALGEFDFEDAARQAMRLQRGLDVRVDVLLEMQRGDVDRDPQRRHPGGGEQGVVSRGLVQHPAAQLHDQSRFFAHADEISGRQQAALGMPPAHQCLQRGRRAVHAEQWLELEHEFAALQRQAQLADQMQSCGHLAFEGRLVRHHAIAAALLGLVHRQVRVHQQRLGYGAGHGRAAPADARADVVRRTGNVERSGQRRVHAGDRLLHAGIVGVLAHQDHELVAAEARHRVDVGHRFLQPLRHHAQGFVASGVAEAVVDQLEVVEIDEQHHDRARVPLGVEQRLLQAVDEQLPVRQAGQLVVGRAECELLLRALAFGDIGLDTDEVGQGAALVAHRSQVEIVPEHLPVLATVVQQHARLALLGDRAPQRRDLELLGIACCRDRRWKLLPSSSAAL